MNFMKFIKKGQRKYNKYISQPQSLTASLFTILYNTLNTLFTHHLTYKNENIYEKATMPCVY